MKTKILLLLLLFENGYSMPRTCSNLFSENIKIEKNKVKEVVPLEELNQKLSPGLAFYYLNQHFLPILRARFIEERFYETEILDKEMRLLFENREAIAPLVSYLLQNGYDIISIQKKSVTLSQSEMQPLTKLRLLFYKSFSSQQIQSILNLNQIQMIYLIFMKSQKGILY